MNKETKTKILMCAPTHMPTEVPYSINPWMKPGEKINTKKAMRQWENLVNTCEQLGAEVDIIEQQKGLPDMVFAADQGIVQGKNVLMSRFRHSERQEESLHYDDWFKNKNFNRNYLPDGIYFEGNGESQFLDNKLFVGHGWRSDESTVSALQDIFPQHDVIGLKIINPRFYHLDVALLAVSNDTAFYYPEAFTKESKNTLEEKIPNLIPISQKEAYGFATNSVVMGEYVIFQRPNLLDSISRSGTKIIEKRIKKLGKEPVGANVSEFNKLGGGIHCLTNILT